MISKRYPQRKKIRLPNYDYSSAGMYFVTICVQNSQYLFGNIVGAGPCAGPNCNIPRMELNEAGEMINKIWNGIPQFYPGVDIDEFIVMPNHVHGIIILNGRPRGAARTLSLSDVMHRFKSLTTAKYSQGVKNRGWKSFRGRLWHRSFYDRIIRNSAELFQIRQYILNNAAKE